MQEFTVLLNLKSVESGIIQLGDLSSRSVNEQFSSLSPSEKRSVSRKLRKLAKKAIKKFAVSPEHRSRMCLSCGFGSTEDRVYKFKTAQLFLARRLLISQISEDSGSDRQ